MSKSKLKLNLKLTRIKIFPNFRYHNWMKCPELQELTASEPLTIDEEYEMQKSWRNDEDSIE